MSEERRKILNMLAEGKITADEAEELLNALYTDKDKGIQMPRKEAKFLRVKVWEEGKEKVNVNLPLSLAKFALKFIPTEAKLSMEEKNIDLDAIIQEIMNGTANGKIVQVEEDDQRVEVVLE